MLSKKQNKKFKAKQAKSSKITSSQVATEKKGKLSTKLFVVHMGPPKKFAHGRSRDATDKTYPPLQQSKTGQGSTREPLHLAHATHHKQQKTKKRNATSSKLTKIYEARDPQTNMIRTKKSHCLASTLSHETNARERECESTYRVTLVVHKGLIIPSICLCVDEEHSQITDSFCPP